MANHRKHRGYRTQKVLADYLKQWWTYADTAGAGRQGEDILNIPTISIEVKARSDFQPLAWIKQAESNAAGKLPMVIMRCNGQGEDAGEYLALLQQLYIGDVTGEYLSFVKVKVIMPILAYVIPTEEITRCTGCGAWMFMKGQCLTCQSMNTNASNPK